MPNSSPRIFAARPLFADSLGVGVATAQLTHVPLREMPPTESGQASAVQSTLRQVGSSLGAAVLGVAPTVATTHHVTSSLESAGVPAFQSEHIAEVVKGSAGTAIPGLSSDPSTAYLAPRLDASFTDAVQTLGDVSAGFVRLDLLASVHIPVGPCPDARDAEPGRRGWFRRMRPEETRQPSWSEACRGLAGISARRREIRSGRSRRRTGRREPERARTRAMRDIRARTGTDGRRSPH